MKYTEAEMFIVSVCRELPRGDTVPEWVELLPVGVDIQGVDGRKFVNDDPSRIINAFNSSARKPMLDWEHASERAWSEAPKPAAAWMTELQARDGGSIWAKVDWTPRGAEAVKNKEYRYLSPALLIDRENRIHRINSAGLTNNPNLNLTALNQAQTSSELNMSTEIMKALGLPPTATVGEAIAAITALNTSKSFAESELQKVLNSVPSLDKYVPRADYDLAFNRANTAEAAITEQRKATMQKEIDTEIDAAKKARKITPATEPTYRTLCQQEGGLQQFREFVKVAPIIASDSNLDNRSPTEGATASLNQVQIDICKRMGITEDEYRKAL